MSFFLQCLPRNRVNQVLYLVWRWLGLIYFFSWLIGGGFESHISTYFIFLTNWSFIIFNIYLIVSAISVSVELARSSSCNSSSEEVILSEQDGSTSPPAGCCGYHDNTIPWCLSMHWFLFMLGNMAAIFVTILFWSALYRGGPLSAGSVHVHLINGIFAFIDVTTSAIPFNSLHVVYLLAYGCIFAVFSGIYFGASQKSIYPVLNYAEYPGTAVGVLLGTVLVAIPLVYLIMFFIAYLCKYCCRCCRDRHLDMNKDEAMLDNGEAAYTTYKESNEPV